MASGWEMGKMAEPASERTHVRRHPERGHYDRETIHAILDAALICHVAFTRDGAPAILPTMHGRLGDALYLHGAAANAMLTAIGKGQEVCIAATIIDALVFGRAAFHQSLNYRSVVLYGRAVAVHDPEEKLLATQALLAHFTPGRAEEVRMPSPSELAITRMVRVDIAEASAKVRTGFPKDEPEDLGLPLWAGMVPLSLEARLPVPDPLLDPDVAVPPSVLQLAQSSRG